jgi:uncharacterized protein YcbX
MSIRIASLQRYPVKGLSPEPLTHVALTKGDYFPGDRLFAIENGPAGFDPDNPQHQPKIKFLMLMRNESLARLKTRYLDSIISPRGRGSLPSRLSSAASCPRSCAARRRC